MRKQINNDDPFGGHPTKECSHCHKRKPLDEFGTNTTARDGKQSWCYECNRLYWQAKEKFNHAPLRTCAQCGEFKPASDFTDDSKICSQCKALTHQYVDDDLSAITDEELIDELRRRGFGGTLYMPIPLGM